ncbi:MAG: hypothetical protein RMJ00_00900 [Nitrososphaerota archaeon]|nr:hypothetical protein [Candidatus Bathyarchaeota archaeon]MCX8162841.1 hypothetical protein [Candidatus Bathyarchaeota archaeon]MDW8061247.1 hypothetical protein [Nitrososphaerota archaeon]
MEIWPYILPLPVDRSRQVEFLMVVLGSHVSMDILRCIGSKGLKYQKELISELPYSNKTVISTLKKLVELGVLTESMEKRVEDSRVKWVKRYEATDIGRWIIYLLIPPQTMSREEVIDVVKMLLKLYIDGLSKLCRSYGIERKIILDMITRYAEELDES